MKKGWEIKTLGEICEVLDSKRKPITKRDRTAGEYPYYGATGILDYVHEYLFDEKLVLIGEDGAKWESGEWTAFIAEGKYWVNNHAHVIRPNRSIVLDNWIVYFLYFSDLHKYVTGLTVPKLNQEKMRSITLPIPPLPEQQRIVSMLDEAFASIAQAKSNAERNLVNARELFESVLEESVAGKESTKWEVKTVGEVSEHSLGKMLDKQKNRGNFQKYLRNINVRWFDFDLSDVNEMRFLEEEKEKYTAIKGDLLICEGGYPGRAAIWEEDYPIYFQKAIHRVRFGKNIMPKWFLYCLYSADLSGRLKKYLTGTGIQHFTGQALDRFEFPVPSLAEQRAIVGRLEALSAETGRLEEIYQQKVESLEEMKKSILAKAFEGEL